MRRFNFMIDAELDELLERSARREGVSKGAVLRRLIRAHVDPHGNEALLGLVGIAPDGGEHVHHDDVVYPR